MIGPNRFLSLLFLVWLCIFTQTSCKNLLKNISSFGANDSLIESSNSTSQEDTINSNESYFSLNELGAVEDHMSLSSRNLVPEILNLAEVSSELDEAKVVTHHFVTNIYLEVKSYLNTPTGVCVLVVLLFLGLLIVAKIVLASNFLKRHQDTPLPINDTKFLKKGNNSEDTSKNNYLSALNEEKSATYRTANSNLRKSFNTFSDLRLPENYSMTKKKNNKKPSSEKNYNTNECQTENFQDFSQAFEEDVDLLMNNIDLEDQMIDMKQENGDKKIKEINILGQQIILNGKPKNRSVRSVSENNENDLYYDLHENYFSDCNLSEIHT